MCFIQTLQDSRKCLRFVDLPPEPAASLNSEFAVLADPWLVIRLVCPGPGPRAGRGPCCQNGPFLPPAAFLFPLSLSALSLEWSKQIHCFLGCYGTSPLQQAVGFSVGTAARIGCVWAPSPRLPRFVGFNEDYCCGTGATGSPWTSV